MSEQEGKERLNNNEFRELIPHLPLSDLLRIEYRKDKWYKLITVVDPVKKLYGCTLCSISNSNAKNLNCHMEGKKHKLNIQDVKQLFHPEYTYVKQDWKLAAGPIKSQPIAKTNVTLTKKTDDASVSSTPNVKPPPKNAKVSVTNAKGVVKDDSQPTSVGSTECSASNPPNSSANIKDTNSTSKAVLPAKTQNLKPQIKSTASNVTDASSVEKCSTPGNIKPKPAITTSNAKNNSVSTPAKVITTPKTTLIKAPVQVKANSETKAPTAAANKSSAVVTTPSVKTAPTVAVKPTLKAIKEVPPAKVANVIGNQKQGSASTTSIGANIKKEPGTTPASKTEPNANDPSWNPKVSVKNLNVTKITKTNAVGTKTPTISKNTPTAKVAVKKVETKPTISTDVKKTSTELVDKTQKINEPTEISTKTSNEASVSKEQAINHSNTNSEPNISLNSSNAKSSDKANVNDTHAATLLESETQSSSKIRAEFDGGKTKSNEKPTLNKSTKSAQKVSKDFSDDVQFEEMSVKFDEKKNETEANMVKNPFALKQDGSKPYRIPKISCVSVDLLKKPVDTPRTGTIQLPEVIIIDDDVPAEDKSTEQSAGKYQQIPIIERHAPKPQRLKLAKNVTQQITLPQGAKQDCTNKRNSEGAKSDSDETLAKKQKIVLNPAAAFLVGAATSDKEAEQQANSTDTPKYQTDRIIIPTKHKEKEKHEIQSTAVTQLDFSTKTFSSKPKDDEVHGLVGVEYVVKIMKSKDEATPRYECSLCELILIGPSMQNHLVGYNHRLKFCEKHFPTAMRQFRQYIEKVPSHEKYKVLTPILAKLAVAIEQHHGRDLPYEVLEYQYNTNRHEILSKVFSCRHASEQHGPAFAHILDSKEIDIIIAQKDNFKAQAGPSNQIFNVRPGGSTSNSSLRREPKRQRADVTEQNSSTPFRAQHPHPYSVPSQYRQPPVSSDFNSLYVPQVDDETHKQMVADFLRGTHKSGSPTNKRDQRERQRHSRRSRSRERTRKRSRSRSKTRNHRDNRKSISPLRDGDIWQAYRHLVDQKMSDLNEVFKVYRCDPETHPMYNDEWQKFWKRRKDELIAAGLDHRSYNYQPEWVRFFKVRIEELFSQAFENIKLQCRERLCLPLNNSFLSDPKYHVQARNTYPETPKVHASVGDTQDVEMSGRQRKANSTELIPVLRLLTALEEYLGSLGPKIIDLMSKALLMEKTNPNQMNETILTIDNCTLLETAMEKLKGVLFAGLLEGTKERAFKKVIADTESLLAFAEENRKHNPYKALPQTYENVNKSTYSSIIPTPVPVPAPALSTSQVSIPSVPGPAPSQQTNTKGAGGAISSLLAQVDKKELAAKLAATLTAQGKTDFNPEQLEQLIAVYTLIEKKKREAAAAAAPATATLTASETSSTSNRKTLSDTLVDFMNPSNPNTSTNVPTINVPEESSAKQSYTAATINRYLDMMRRTGGVFPNSGAGVGSANEIWQNLQNIQRSMGGNTNINQSIEIQPSNIRNTLGYGAASSFNKPSQLGLSSNGSLNISSSVQPSLRNSTAGVPLNTFVGGIGSKPSGMQPYLQQNPYLLHASAPFNASGSFFANTNNNSRVSSNNININTQQNQQQQPRKDIPSLQSIQTQLPFPGQTTNQNWMTKSGGRGGGNQRWKNQRGSEGGGVRQNPGGERSSGKNQNWRNN